MKGEKEIPRSFITINWRLGNEKSIFVSVGGSFAFTFMISLKKII